MSSQVTEKLNAVLANIYFLYLKTQNYHWNVTGVHFAELHKLFENQYEDLADAVDLIAERIRALGEKAPGTFKAFQKYQIIEDGNSNLDWAKMVKELYDDHKKVIKLLNETAAIAESNGDESTLDMMVERLRIHEKTTWMLNALIQ